MTMRSEVDDFRDEDEAWRHEAVESLLRSAPPRWEAPAGFRRRVLASCAARPARRWVLAPLAAAVLVIVGVAWFSMPNEPPEPAPVDRYASLREAAGAATRLADAALEREYDAVMADARMIAATFEERLPIPRNLGAR